MNQLFGKMSANVLPPFVCTLPCFNAVVWFQDINYRKVPKFSDPSKLSCNLSQTRTKRPNLRVFCQKDPNGIANSEDPDQTAPLGAMLAIKLCYVQTILFIIHTLLEYKACYKELVWSHCTYKLSLFGFAKSHSAGKQ